MIPRSGSINRYAHFEKKKKLTNNSFKNLNNPQLFNKWFLSIIKIKYNNNENTFPLWGFFATVHISIIISVFEKSADYYQRCVRAGLGFRINTETIRTVELEFKQAFDLKQAKRKKNSKMFKFVSLWISSRKYRLIQYIKLFSIVSSI